MQEKESNMVFFESLGSAQHGHPLGWKLPSRKEHHIRFLYGSGDTKAIGYVNVAPTGKRLRLGGVLTGSKV